MAPEGGQEDTGEPPMTTLQKIYREIRQYLTKEEARYAAPRILEYGKGHR